MNIIFEKNTLIGRTEEEAYKIIASTAKHANCPLRIFIEKRDEITYEINIDNYPFVFILSINDGIITDVRLING